MNKLFTALCIGCVGLLTGCGSITKPDLWRLYSQEKPRIDQPPVILIPGLLGSKLRDRVTKEEVWPGSFSKLIFGGYENLALDIDPVTLQPKPSLLEAYGITEAAFGNDFYGEIIKTLEQYGGYIKGTPGEPIKVWGPRYYVFPYDWRQDNLKAVQALDNLIEQIRRDYGKPQLKVDIIAHSMGGLIVRYFVNYGTTDVLDKNDFPMNMYGASRINKVIMLGTPNLGAVGSMHSFLVGVKIGFARLNTEVLTTMPSVYQLFPHPLNSWIITTKGKDLDRDLFDREIWERFEWSIFDSKVQQRIKSKFTHPAEGEARIKLLQDYFEKHLERARRFVWSLSIHSKETPLRYIVFGGDCELTPARLVVEDIQGDSLVRLYPNEIAHPVPGVDYERLMLEPGDGRVTKASLLARESLDPTVPPHEYLFFPLAYSFSLCESHDRLTSNVHFQNNLLNVLLTRSNELERSKAKP